MVRNPMESAGCYAICAAVLRNQSPAIEKLDFQVSLKYLVLLKYNLWLFNTEI